uniref:Dihydrolipoamide acetyltransferase component of pyruvate dehydrogenase complex n=1 Tax=Amphimedon queenslandica TaxID=400682 RepID=A0A1X7V708_AMPQE
MFCLRGRELLPRLLHRHSSCLAPGKLRSNVVTASHIDSVSKSSKLSLPISSGSHHRLLASVLSPIKFQRFVSSSSILCNEYKIVNTPAFAESISEGDVKWDKNVGDFVKEDEIIAEIETDKTAIPIPSPVFGIIEEIFVPDGEKVVAGDQLCKIKVSAEAPPPTASPPTPKESATPPPPPPSPPSAPPPPSAPSAAGPIPTTPPPPPPLPTMPLGNIPPPPPLPSFSAPSQSVGVVSRSEKRTKMSRMRQRIAERLKEAQNVNAMLTTFNEVDMSSVIELRKKFQDAFVKKHGIKLGFMSPFVKAACSALEDQPVVNAVIDNNEIIYRDYIDISVAVATPKGLVVPVVRNVNVMNYADIEKEIASLGQKARDVHWQ